MKTLRLPVVWFILLAFGLSGCSGLFQTPAPTPLPPAEYLENALQWLQTNAAMAKNVDWEAIRGEARTLTPDLKTTASTYPAICLALGGLKDGNAWLDGSQQPDGYTGYLTLFPANRMIIGVDPGSAADRAGLRVGDVIESLNGAPPRPYTGAQGAVCNAQGDSFSPQDQLSLRRPGQDDLIQVTIQKGPIPPDPDPSTGMIGQRLGNGPMGIGYLELPMETGSRSAYASVAQQQLQKLDQTSTCGWILDLRRLQGGDIWSYMAAVGPILGEADLGGFVYPDGRREPWAYRKGQVYWDGNRRDEGIIDGSVYALKHAAPPVALLTSPATAAAGELLVVAFQGRPDVRSFGEATRGLPTLIAHTDLSDGARIFVSGAFSFDRSGKTYAGPIEPDTPVTTNWPKFGAAQDPVLQAAQNWLQTQPGCKP